MALGKYRHMLSTVKFALRIITAFLTTFSVGFLGLFFVDSDAANWYDSLAKPDFALPTTAFPIVWTVLYTLLAIALAIVWKKSPQTELTSGWVRFYFVQLLFNGAWMLFFFGLHAILVAFLDILFLGFIVMALMIAASEIDRRALYLLLPTLLWILFAAYLNVSIWLMN